MAFPRSWTALILSLALSASGTAAAADVSDCTPGLDRKGTSPAIPVHVDRRVELATILARLAGYEEYQAPGIPAYDRAVADYFERYRAHPSVAAFKRLRDENGIAYNAVVELALAADATTWRPAISLSPWPDNLDARWDRRSVRAFLAAARRFERDTHASDFFAGQAALYTEVEAAIGRNLAGRLDPCWYLTRMPARGITDFAIVPGLLAGNNSYGPHMHYADGREVVFGVLATPVQRDGAAIEYPPDAQLALLAHEFHHPYMNAWADRYQAVLLPAAERLFAPVASQMKELAYGEPKILLYESLVRAQTERYLRSHGEADVLRRAVAEDRSKSFLWVPALADLFDAMDATGARPAFDQASAERVAALLNDWARDGGAKVAAERARLAAEEDKRLATGPQVLRYLPAPGAVVASDLNLLEIEFDRPMAPGLAIFGDTPDVAGKPSWDPSHRILRIPVRVHPGARYRMYLNNEDSLKMQSAAGEPLVPRVWSFSVQAAEE